MAEKRFTIAGTVFNEQAPEPKPRKKKAVKAEVAPVKVESVPAVEEPGAEDQASESA